MIADDYSVIQNISLLNNNLEKLSNNDNINYC